MILLFINNMKEEMNNKRGFFAIGVFDVKHMSNVSMLWRTANVMGADFIFTIGQRYRPKKKKIDTMNTPEHKPLFEFDDWDTFRDCVPKGSEIVGVEMSEKSRHINDFTHPQRAIYLLGAEDVGLSNEIMEDCDHLVQLPGSPSMNVAISGSIVLYDRSSKESKLI